MIVSQRLLWIALVCLTCNAAGCRLPAAKTVASPESEVAPTATTRITYSTASDRLNLAGGAATTLLAAHGHASQMVLPNMTRSTMQIQYPHPSGTAESAQVTLITHLDDDETASVPTMLASFASQHPDSPRSDRRVVDVVTLDIPAWQAVALRNQLQQQKFFRRSRVLNAEVELAVDEPSGRFGKSFHSVPEFDALLLRAAMEGRQLRPNPNPQI
ncbi:hypothetical protein Poly24_44180 [Rosistilla carotiformis]|uniref:Preprotein translocase subunit SecD n=1 Tax=Rosistilla carotiformis TaxID=2528017 RepID=A0A518JYS0_9BACT|nr:hypothetical protein Poly24_44180 [Rosistilla carotiformis]